MTKQEQMLAALMAAQAGNARFGSVDFAGTPVLEALGGEQADIQRRNRALFEPPTGSATKEQAFSRIARALLGRYQKNQEAADTTDLYSKLATPEITEADYEAYSSPYKAEAREAEKRAELAPTDQGLGIDAQDLYTPASLDMPVKSPSLDMPVPEPREIIRSDTGALGLDSAQLGTFQSQAGTADQYIDMPLGEDPRMMSALIGDPQTVEQERGQIAGDFALDQSSPGALLDRIGGVETRTDAGRNLQQQMTANARVQQANALRTAALLEDEREEARNVADRLAAANFLKARITAESGGADSALVAQHKHLDLLRVNLAALTASKAPAAEIAKAQQQVRDMEIIIRADQVRDQGANIATISTWGRDPTLLEKEVPPEQRVAHIYAKQYGFENATAAAERDNILYDKVTSAQKVNKKVGVMLARLDTMDADFGGKLQGWQTALDSIVADFGGEEATRNATDAQFMAALQGSTVFELLKILGIGARGLDTPAEREFLQEVIAGRNTLTHGALVRMALGRASQGNDIYEQWNKRTNDGRLRSWYDLKKEKEVTFAQNIFLPKGANEEDVTNAMKQLEAFDRPSSRDDAIAYLYELRRRQRAEKKGLKGG